MNRHFSHLNTAVKIIDGYKGEEPFSSFLKKYFSLHRKYGSKDRRQISHLCYCYFRLGKAVLATSTEERILLGLFLCSNEYNEVLQHLKPAWNEQITANIKDKCSVPVIPLNLNDVFPWEEELTGGIRYGAFCESFFIQPDLFLRLRPGREEQVKMKLENSGIKFNQLSDTCLALSNSSKIDEAIELNKEAVVQDYNSQRVGELLTHVKQTSGDNITRVWDCCAASGGKSIMVKDLLGNIDLTVSDIRESIIHNLKKRFAGAGIKNFKSFVADLSGKNSSPTIQSRLFNLIIADVPCSGSGTWSRTPEQLYYFRQEKIGQYADLQKKIVANAIKQLSPGGYFLYITCSVFKRENEVVVEFMKDNCQLELVRQEVLAGYDKKADTMFAALLTRPL